MISSEKMDKREKHRIDRIFRTPLKTYTQEPPEEVWGGIRAGLDADRRKRRMAWIGRIAASAALILAAGSVWVLLHRESSQEIVKSGHTEAPSGTEKQAAEPAGEAQEKLKESPAGTGTPEIRKTIAGKGTEPGKGPAGHGQHLPVPFAAENRAGTAAALQANLTKEREAEGFRMQGRDSSLRPIPGIFRVNFRQGSRESDFPLAVHVPGANSRGGESGIDVFEEFGEPGQAGYRKWAVGGQVSPLYSYRNLESVPYASSSSSASNGVYNNLEGGILSYAGGINLNYSPARRLSIQSGIYYSRMGMSIANAALAQSSDLRFYSNFPSGLPSVSNSTGQIVLRAEGSNTVMTTASSKEEFMDVSDNPSGSQQNQDFRTGELIQHFETLELPLILRYRVVDRRVGLNLLGGLSSNFLIGNSVYFKEDGNSEYIGQTGDIRTVNYGSVVGLGLEYSLSGNLSINLEPTFRYYLNSINTLSGVGSHPYSLGIFTGIYYSF